jgi:hypothetical protein
MYAERGDAGITANIERQNIIFLIFAHLQSLKPAKEDETIYLPVTVCSVGMRRHGDFLFPA